MICQSWLGLADSRVRHADFSVCLRQNAEREMDCRMVQQKDLSNFVISTFNTDYVLTKTDYFARALGLLEKAWYKII